MKGELLSIGEVSKMKGVGVKSLRYYERMGVLPPAYVDPDSGYRYYSMRQMVDIDIITTCIDLGIPLRELREYLREGNSMDLEGLLDWSRQIALENLRRAEITLSQLDGYLEETRIQKKLTSRPGPYLRELPEQCMICAARDDRRFNLKRYITATTELYEQAKAAGIIPLYAQGLLRIAPGHPAQPDIPAWRAFVSAAVPSWMSFEQARSAVESAGEGRIVRVPAGTFCGQRIEAPSLGTCFEEIIERAREAKGTVFATEIWDAGLTELNYAVEMLEELPARS